MIKFYRELAESFGITVTSSGKMYLGDDKFIIDDKHVVLPVPKMLDMIEEEDDTTYYIFNPLRGNKNVVRAEYKKLLSILNINAFAALKLVMYEIVSKLEENDTSGIATPTLLGKLLAAKGKSKTLLTDKEVKIFEEIQYKDLVQFIIVTPSIILDEKMDAGVVAYSPILEDDVLEDTDLTRKQKDLIKIMVSEIIGNIIKETKMIGTNSDDVSEFIVLLKLNTYLNNIIKEYQEIYEIDDVGYVEPTYNLKKLTSDLDANIKEAMGIIDVVGDNIVRTKTISSPSRSYATREEGVAVVTNRDTAVKKLHEIRKKETVTLDDIREIRELESLISDYDRGGRSRRDRGGNRSNQSRRSIRDDVDRDRGRSRYDMDRGGRYRDDDDDDYYEERDRGRSSRSRRGGRSRRDEEDDYYRGGRYSRDAVSIEEMYRDKRYR